MYDAWPITNGSLLRRLANRRTSVGQDYETSDRHNILVHDNYHTRFAYDNCVHACTRFLSVNHLGLWYIWQTFVLVVLSYTIRNHELILMKYAS